MINYCLNQEEINQIDPNQITNINIGILGHVDSGKTSLARALTKVSSTAALDKNPQSQERGITLDLGFSCFLTKIPGQDNKYYQYTLVDCPGHASLIRTIICGASIIDIMFLVVDVNKGIQTQTAECLVIAELLVDRLVVILNKIDTIQEKEREQFINKKIESLKKVFSKTKFQNEIDFIPISATENINIKNLIKNLVNSTKIPQRDQKGKFIFLIDHCFGLKGKGTVVTGTVIQGQVKCNDQIQFSQVSEKKIVKSLQMFKKSVNQGKQGDRIGMLIKNLDSTLIERGIAYTPGYLSQLNRFIININKIKFFKQEINNKAKFHISCNNQTVMGQLFLFSEPKSQQQTKNNYGITHLIESKFDFEKEYEYLEKIEKDDLSYWAILQLEKPIVSLIGSFIIGSKFDTDITANLCRISFFGHIYDTETQKLNVNFFKQVSKEKQKLGYIDRIIDEFTIIVKDLFKAETNPDIFLNHKVEIEGANTFGIINSCFGKSGKVKCIFKETIFLDSEFKQIDNLEERKILFKYKKQYYNKIS